MPELFGRALRAAAGPDSAPPDLGRRAARRDLLTGAPPRRVARRCLASPGLSLAAIERGIARCGDLAAKAGRSVGFAPRNMLALADQAKGGSRGAFEGSVDEVAGDIRRVRSLGCEWMTFDLPRGDVAGMTRAMGRLTKEVRPAV